MPVLKDFRQTKVISLPSWPDSKVEIYDSVLVRDAKGLNMNPNNLQSIIEGIPYLIKSWNFTDEDGKTLEINFENMGFFKADDVQYLSEQVVAFNKEVKKKTSSSQQ